MSGNKNQKIKNEYFRESFLTKVSYAKVTIGEEVKVVVLGIEDKIAARAIIEGADVNNIMQEIKDRFNTLTMWVCKKEDNKQTYYLMPKYIAYMNNIQFIVHECPRCGFKLGTMRIYDIKSSLPAEETILCAQCGKEIAHVTPVNYGREVQINAQEAAVLLQFFAEEHEVQIPSS